MVLGFTTIRMIHECFPGRQAIYYCQYNYLPDKPGQCILHVIRLNKGDDGLELSCLNGNH